MATKLDLIGCSVGKIAHRTLEQYQGVIPPNYKKVRSPEDENLALKKLLARAVNDRIDEAWLKEARGLLSELKWGVR